MSSITNLVNIVRFQNKIAKHGRKLMDYDIARHNVHSLENAKKRNEFRCTQVWSCLYYLTVQCSSNLRPCLYNLNVLSCYYNTIFIRITRGLVISKRLFLSKTE